MSSPMNGGMHEKVMKYILSHECSYPVHGEGAAHRTSLTRRVVYPTVANQRTDTTFLGMPYRMTCELVKPNDALMTVPNVVSAPLTMDDKNALVNWKYVTGSMYASRNWSHFHVRLPVMSVPVWLLMIRALAMSFSRLLIHRTSLGVPALSATDVRASRGVLTEHEPSDRASEQSLTAEEESNTPPRRETARVCRRSLGDTVHGQVDDDTPAGIR